MNDLITLAEAARRLGRTKQTVYKWRKEAARQGGLLSFNGRTVKFPSYQNRESGGRGQLIMFDAKTIEEVQKALRV